MTGRGADASVSLHSSVEDLGGGVRRTRLLRDGQPLTRADVLALWRDDARFGEWFGQELAREPFAGFFWETPPLTASTLGRPYEHVVVGSRSVAALRADPDPFRDALGRASPEGIACFWNLGGDALLVAPAPLAEPSVCAHLGAFVRGAPAERGRALWRALAAAVEARLGERPLWVSTSGLGVAWLHLRLDARPKYYQHRPYRSADGGAADHSSSESPR